MPKVPDGAGALCPYVFLLVGSDFKFEGLPWPQRRLVQEGALGQLDLEWLRHPDVSWGRWGAARSLRLGDREPVRGLRGLEGGLVPRCSQTPPFLCLVAMRVSPCEVREE